MSAKRDQNTIPTALGVSSSDVNTLLLFRLDPTTDYLLASLTVNDGITPTSAIRCKRDQNDKPTMYGISSTDGVTLVPIRTDSNGKLLITLT